MKYFHRTTVPPDDVMSRAVEHFGGRLTREMAGDRRTVFSGALGSVSVEIKAEGGHYTLVTLSTNQPGESELDRLAKRFLGEVHRIAEPEHPLRGAY